jgi:hypothetical protein
MLDMLRARGIFVQLSVEFVAWIADQFRENYQLDAVSIAGAA